VTRSRLIPWLLAAFLALSLLATFADAHAAPTPDPAPVRVTMRQPAWMKPLVRRLSVCETHGNLRFRRGPYEGFVAWAAGTWDADKPSGFPDHAYEATIVQQHRVALISLRRGRYFGCLNHAWVRG
jgi:hypothetical protein